MLLLIIIEEKGQKKPARIVIAVSSRLKICIGLVKRLSRPQIAPSLEKKSANTAGFALTALQ